MMTRSSCLVLFLVLTFVFGGLAQGQESEIPLGSPMPGNDTALLDQNGQQVTLANLAGSKATVIVFWSNRCPWTAKYEDRVRKLHSELGGSGTGNTFILVNSNDGTAFPEESAQESVKYLNEHKIAGFYLTDSRSMLARAFGATRTPHVFVFDSNATLVYVGAVDDSPGDAERVQKEYLRDALTAIGAGRQVASPQTKAFGCMIRFVQ